MKPAHNSTYPKVAVQWLNQALCFVSSSVLAGSFHFVAASRCAPKSATTQICKPLWAFGKTRPKY